MWAELTAARDALTSVVSQFADANNPGSCKIGLEDGISPRDYPLIRLVPARATPGKPYGNRSIETLVYIGLPLTKAEGVEALYEDLARFEAATLAALRTLGGRYVETLYDDDPELKPYKVLAIRCELTAAVTTG